MYKTLLILVCSFCVIQAFSQQDSLLKKFKYRINNYQAINFNIGAASQLNRLPVVAGAVTNSSSYGSFGGGYYSIKSTDRILLTTTAYLNTAFQSDRYNNPNNVNKSNYLSVAPQVSILNKWFSKNKFTELGASIFSNTNSSKNTAQNIPGLAKYYQGQYSFAINTGIGKGRLENITDMQNALWLSKALQTANSLSRPLTATELNELGRSITTANNTRVLDARKRTLFILETVDNYLQQKGLINKTDIRYFSNLNDILFFAFNSQRLSGTEKYIRFTPGINLYGTNQSQNYDSTKFKHRLNNKSLLLSTGINKYTPQNLIHQNNYGASLKLSYNNFDITDKGFTRGVITTDTKANSNFKQATVNLFYEHAIYPNTRTSINFNLQTQGGYQDIDKETSFFGSVSLVGTLNYFISYRTRLTGSLSTAYQKNVYSIGQYLNYLPDNLLLYASAGVNISL
ncbi:hypothetical protein [Ferruginibacter sp.]|uniref:hypothetical protein n=1 Tax=Ferruginibacter sp. TaxID=1940288 RepID=UPI0019A67775|nr:hypothetical protein [Ferruginibacter sp.]MBC7627425.1 hypothetical protein [Ferruginibacter sp.]